MYANILGIILVNAIMTKQTIRSAKNNKVFRIQITLKIALSVFKTIYKIYNIKKIKLKYQYSELWKKM